MAKSVVYNMDCMEALREMPDKCFDLAVADPPYFSGPEKRGYYGKAGGGIGGRRDYDLSPAWDIPGREYFCELFRVSKRWIVWGCNYFDFRFPPGRIVWDKCNGSSICADNREYPDGRCFVWRGQNTQHTNAWYQHFKQRFERGE